MEWSFGYGESEYDARCDGAPRSGDLYLSDPGTLERSGSGIRSEEQNRATAKYAIGRSKPGLPMQKYPEMKGQRLFFIFVKKANSKLPYFDLSSVYFEIKCTKNHHRRSNRRSVLPVTVSLRKFTFLDLP